ncbi:hypothetical protein, variant [Aphanomyces astaci]|uniref:WW domain-containing protein n=1 Tax=Aphanomyces astaci TaxID=112090 RepID=W4H4X4_APHAT|nr:hypothetical protein, variant [Aphanomyces astaci]ETV86314.1 hypothetical protein, variant [Aphanomyces astaci]|eukprot:XP_009824786.1 hypothetical protein, variant [Aphanomyces astaci]
MPLPPSIGDEDAIIKHIFHVYADVPTHRLSNSNFRRLTLDAPNLLTPWFGMVDVDLAYAQARGHSCRRLDVTQFVEALVLLAWRKYPEEAQQDAFLRLLNESIYLLPVASKLAHARAAEFATARLGRSANQVDAFDSLLPLTSSSPCFAWKQQHDVDILGDFLAGDYGAVDNTDDSDPEVAPLESLMTWHADGDAALTLDDATSSQPVGHTRVAAAAYLLGTMRAIIKSNQRAKRRRAFQIWHDRNDCISCRIAWLAMILKGRCHRKVHLAWTLWQRNYKHSKVTQQQRLQSLEWTRARQTQLLQAIMTQWYQTVAATAVVRAQFRRMWKQLTFRRLRSRWLRWRLCTVHRRTCVLSVRRMQRMRGKKQLQLVWSVWQRHCAKLNALSFVMWKTWQRTSRSICMALLTEAASKTAKRASAHNLIRMVATWKLMSAWMTWTHQISVQTHLVAWNRRGNQRMIHNILRMWQEWMVQWKLQKRSTRRLVQMVGRRVLSRTLYTLRKASWSRKVHLGQSILIHERTMAMASFLRTTLRHLRRQRLGRAYTNWTLHTLQHRFQTRRRLENALSKVFLLVGHGALQYRALQTRFHQWRTLSTVLRDTSAHNAQRHNDDVSHRHALGLQLLGHTSRRHHHSRVTKLFRRWMQYSCHVAASAAAIQRATQLWTKVHVLRPAWRLWRATCRRFTLIARCFEHFHRYQRRRTLQGLYTWHAHTQVAHHEDTRLVLRSQLVRHVLGPIVKRMVRRHQQISWIKWWEHISHAIDAATRQALFVRWWRQHRRHQHAKSLQSALVKWTMHIADRRHQWRMEGLLEIYASQKVRSSRRLAFLTWTLAVSRHQANRRSLCRLKRLWVREQLVRHGFRWWRRRLALQRLNIMCFHHHLSFAVNKWRGVTREAAATALKSTTLGHLVEIKRRLWMRQRWTQWCHVTHASCLWQVGWSREHSAHFYWNALTGRSQWEPPQHSAISRGGSHAAEQGAALVHSILTHRNHQQLEAATRRALTRWRMETLHERLRHQLAQQLHTHVAATHALMQAQVTSCYDTSWTLLQHVKTMAAVFGQWKLVWKHTKYHADVVVRTTLRMQLAKIFRRWKQLSFDSQRQQQKTVDNQIRAGKYLLSIMARKATRRQRRAFHLLQRQTSRIKLVYTLLRTNLARTQTRRWWHCWTSRVTVTRTMAMQCRQWQHQRLVQSSWMTWRHQVHFRQRHRVGCTRLERVLNRRELRQHLRQWLRRSDQWRQLHRVLHCGRKRNIQRAWGTWQRASGAHQTSQARNVLQAMYTWRVHVLQRQRARTLLRTCIGLLSRRLAVVALAQWKWHTVTLQSVARAAATSTTSHLRLAWRSWSVAIRQHRLQVHALRRVILRRRSRSLQLSYSRWNFYLVGSRHCQQVQTALRKYMCALQTYQGKVHALSSMLARRAIGSAIRHFHQVLQRYVAQAFHTWRLHNRAFSFQAKLDVAHETTRRQIQVAACWRKWSNFRWRRVQMTWLHSQRPLQRALVSATFSRWSSQGLARRASWKATVSTMETCRWQRNLRSLWNTWRATIETTKCDRISLCRLCFNGWSTAVVRCHVIQLRSRNERQAQRLELFQAHRCLCTWQAWTSYRRVARQRGIATLSRLQCHVYWRNWTTFVDQQRRFHLLGNYKVANYHQFKQRCRKLASIVTTLGRAWLRRQFDLWNRHSHQVQIDGLTGALAWLDDSHEQRLRVYAVWHRWRRFSCSSRTNRLASLRQCLWSWKHWYQRHHRRRVQLAATVQRIAHSHRMTRWRQCAVFRTWQQRIVPPCQRPGMPMAHSKPLWTTTKPPLLSAAWRKNLSKASLLLLVRRKSHYMGALILHLTLLKRRAHHLTQAFHSWHERSVGTKWVWCLMPVRLASAMVQIKYHIFVAKREVCQLYDQLQEVESTGSSEVYR